MNRQILFRGKRIDNGEWVHGYLIGDDVIVGEIIEFEDEYFYCEFWWKVEPKTVGQATGLPDKKGVKTFEGDFVKHPNGNIGKVFWRADLAAFHIDFGKEDPRVVNSYEYEVIGNEHDNPDLLKDDLCQSK